MNEEPHSSAHLDEPLDELRRAVAGAVIAPTEASYDPARRCFNALVDRRPAVIVRCLGADDVATAFDFALPDTASVTAASSSISP
jgi:hypothetical protein